MKVLSLAMLAVALSAGETGPATLSLAVTQSASLSQRLASGPYGEIWRLPEVQRWREDLARLCGADADWVGLPQRADALRLALTVAPPHGGLPLIRAQAAVLMPTGHDPASVPGMTTQRVGAWWLASVAFSDPRLPEGPQLEGGRGNEDLGLTMDLQSALRILPTEDVQAWAPVLKGWGLRHLQAWASADGQGVAEHIDLAGAQPPFRPVALTALAGLPARPLALFAVGIDGKKMASSARAFAIAMGVEAQALDVELPARTGQDLETLVSACDGTLVAALLPGQPWPSAVVSLPANAATDAAFQAMAESMQPGTGAQALAAASEQPVQLGAWGPWNWAMRRSPQRWYLGSDAQQLSALAADQSATFPAETLWPGAEKPVALAWWDGSALVSSLGALLPLVPGESPAARHANSLRAACAVSAPHLPPASLAATMDAKGLHLNGRDALCGPLLPLLAMSGTVVPDLAASYARAAQAKVRERMTRIFLTCASFRKETNGHWPRDLADLRAWAKGLDEDAFATAANPDIVRPYCYVFPTPGAPPEQPLMVQDPACNKGEGSYVLYVDGRIAYVAGTAFWKDALRLAGIAHSTGDEGIDVDQWTVLPKSF